jgi:hypothetical protein
MRPVGARSWTSSTGDGASTRARVALAGLRHRTLEVQRERPAERGGEHRVGRDARSPRGLASVAAAWSRSSAPASSRRGSRTRRARKQVQQLRVLEQLGDVELRVALNLDSRVEPDLVGAFTASIRALSRWCSCQLPIATAEHRTRPAWRPRCRRRGSCRPRCRSPRARPSATWARCRASMPVRTAWTRSAPGAGRARPRAPARPAAGRPTWRCRGWRPRARAAARGRSARDLHHVASVVPAANCSSPPGEISSPGHGSVGTGSTASPTSR